MAENLEFYVKLVRAAASFVVVAFAMYYYRRVRRRRIGGAWMLILLAVVSIPLAEATELLAFAGNLPHTIADLFRLFTEIVLATGILRLYTMDLAEGKAREASLTERAQQAERLSSATLELSASLELNEVLQGLVQQVLELTNADSAAVYYPGDDTTSSESKVLAVRRGEDSPQLLRHYPVELIRQVVRTGQPEIIQDLVQHPLGKSLTELESIALFPLLRENRVTGVLFVGFRRKHRFHQNDQHLLSAFAAHAALAMRNAELYETVERLSVTDALTGLANRRRFDQALNDELHRARRYGKPLALILFDLDHFKAINDRFGHLAGDLVIKTMAEILRQSARETDLAVRLGGDEFALILPETEEADAFQVAERVRWQLASTPIVSDGLVLNIAASPGVSGGVGQFLPADPTTLFQLADRALYRAKEQELDHVVVEQTNGPERREPFDI